LGGAAERLHVRRRRIPKNDGCGLRRRRTLSRRPPARNEAAAAKVPGSPA
jgi:hypothetical protein